MSLFRDPYYLDVAKLEPFANFHGVEVASEINVTIRDLGKGRASASLGVSTTSIGGEKGSESEVTQSRTTKAHPVSALNDLLNKLADGEDGGLLQDVPEQALKRTHLEVDREWAVSSATDLGAFLSTAFKAFASNPSTMRQGQEMPPEVVSALMDPESSPKEGVVMQAEERDQWGRSIILLLDAGNLLPGHDLQDLEQDLTVFGQIDSVVDPGKRFSLEKFLLAGVSRPMRRLVKTEELIGAFSGMPQLTLDAETLNVEGPAIVIRPIAIY